MPKPKLGIHLDEDNYNDMMLSYQNRFKSNQIPLQNKKIKQQYESQKFKQRKRQREDKRQTGYKQKQRRQQKEKERLYRQYKDKQAAIDRNRHEKYLQELQLKKEAQYLAERLKQLEKRYQKQKERSKLKLKERQRQRHRQNFKVKERERSRERGKQRQRQRSKQKQKQKEREIQRQRSRQKQREIQKQWPTQKVKQQQKSNQKHQKQEDKNSQENRLRAIQIFQLQKKYQELKKPKQPSEKYTSLKIPSIGKPPKMWRDFYQQYDYFVYDNNKDRKDSNNGKSNEKSYDKNEQEHSKALDINFDKSLNSQSKKSKRKPKCDHDIPMDQKVVLLQNLDYKINQKQLQKIGLQFGQIQICKIFWDNTTGRSLQVGVIWYKQLKSATKATKYLSGQMFNGKQLKTRFIKYYQRINYVNFPQRAIFLRNDPIKW